MHSDDMATLNVDELAEKIACDLMDRVEYDGCLHKSSIIDVARKVLAVNVHAPKTRSGTEPCSDAEVQAYKDAIKGLIRNPPTPLFSLDQNKKSDTIWDFPETGNRYRLQTTADGRLKVTKV